MFRKPQAVASLRLLPYYVHDADSWNPRNLSRRSLGVGGSAVRFLLMKVEHEYEHEHK